MKKFLFLFVCMLWQLGAAAQFSGSGSGTASDPYLIFNPTQLAQMANFLNNSDVVFELKNDINLAEFISDNYPSEGWAPIGVSATPFKGTLKGNDRTISGLSINRSSTEFVGLFGYLNGAKIDNLTLEVSTVKGGAHTGVFAGYATDATLTNIHVTATGVTGGNYTGGFIGQTASCTINTLTLTVSGTGVTGSNRTGGALGIASGTCQAAHIETAVLGTSYVGGFAGSAGANFTNCSVKGNVVGTSTHVGGFAGNASTSVFTACNQYGDVCGTGRVGGICGNSQEAPTFADCKSQGKITSTGDYTGGVLGYGDFVSMTNCSHFGDIQGTNYVGGVYGGNPQTQQDYPVYYWSTNYTSNTKGGSWTNTSRFTKGNVNTRIINKCTAIGNVTGALKIGGLVGSHEAGRTFRFSSAGQSDSSGTFGRGSSGYCYLWRGNTCVYSSGTRYYSPTDYVDYTTLNVANSYYSGNVTGTDDVGGLIGNKICGEIKNCYAYANVVGETNVGGLVGSVTGNVVSGQGTLTIKSSAAINTTVNATKNYVGRIYGYKADDYVTIGALGTADGNLSLNKTSVVKSGVVQTITDNLQNGTSIGQSMLKLKATYVAKGWNFDNDWTIQETESYPYMRYQAAPPVIESNLVSQATSVSGKSINGGTVYLYYKDNAPVSQDCSGSHNWAFTTEPLQSGAEVRLYADAEGLTPSYFTTTTVAYPGSGTEEDPYLVYSAADLQGVSKQGYYKLMNDINLTDWIAENSPSKGWVSIGRNGTEATYIDGDGHKITGLWTNTTDDYTGLFSNFSRGSIKNLTVEVASGKKVKGGNYTGILIGRNANGTIQNVIVKGDVQGTQYVGGVMGSSSINTINTVTYEGAVSSTTASARLGGIAGEASNNTVTSCRLDVTITSSGNTAYVGSAFGTATGTMTKTLANCNINATGTENRVGGLMGNGSMSISQSLTTGVVKATGTGSYAGGLVGYATGSITDCYSTATTTGTDYTAGLVAYTTSSINMCYAKGDATGVLNGAGLVAQLDGSGAKVQNSVAVNNQLTFTDQSSWASRVIGGYKNGAADPDNSNYALKTMQVTLNGVATKKYDDLVEGIAKEQSVLQTSAFYESLGWDMTSTWAIDEGQMYPYLLWEVDINPVVEITFDKATAVVAAGNTLTLTPNIQPLSATNKRLTWTTSKASVATVEDGVVTAVSVGEATITATATDGSGVSAQCKVTVVANHDEAIAQLRDDVDAALALYNNSTEGDNIGEYVAGSRAALLKVINEVRAMISDTMDETAISDCSSKLTKAVADFKAQKVNAGEDTDITLLDNTIYIEPLEAAAGQTVKLSVKMKNNVEVKGFQFDLYLPEGVTVATDEDGFALADLSLARTTKNKTDYFGCEFQRDGAFRVLCGSTKGYAFNGTDGEVCTIELNIADDMEEGDFPIILKTVEMTDKSNSPYTTDYLKSTLTISSYTLGDVNNDGKVTITDFMCAADAILGNVPAVYVERAADFNTDGNVTVSDLMSLADYILSGGAPAKMPARVRMMVGEEQTENYIYLEPVTAARGGQQTLSVKMKNSESIKGYQVDIYLPEGMTFAQDEDDFYLAEMSTVRTTTSKTDYFGCNIQSDGALRLLCGSTKGYTFSGNDGEVATVVVNVPEDMAVGDYSIILRNCELTNSTNTAFTNAYSESKVTVTDGEAEVFEEGYALQIIPFAMDVDADFEASVMMDNVEAVKSIEFDLVLPEGLYLDGEDGEYFVDCGSRVTSSTVSGRFQSSVEENVDGSLHMLCNFSRTTASYVFTGNEGEALVLPLYADGLADGIYTLELKNIVLNGDLKVAPYKASVFVGKADAEGDIKLYGNYTEEAVDVILDAFETNEAITSIDMTEAYAVAEDATVETANPNALIYVAEGTALANTQNVVVGDECENLVLTDGYDFYAPVAFEAKNASYSRTVAQDGWYSLVLPFVAEIPAGVTVEKFQSLDEANSMANFAKVMTMEGNVPYIFEATAGAVAFEAQNVAVAATPAALTDGAFTGTYATTEAGSVTGQYALRADGTGFGVCDATAYVPAFRAYLQAAGGASNIRIAHDSVTAIKSVATEVNTDCYNLSGRRISSRAKGIVISNNVKRIKK